MNRHFAASIPPPGFGVGRGTRPFLWAAAVLTLGFAIPSLPAALTLAAVGAAALFFFALRDLSFGVMTIVASVPVQSALSLDLGGKTVTMTKVAVATTIAAWAIRVAAGVSRPRLNSIAIALGIYVLVLTISIVEARNLGAWAGEVYRWFVSLVVYVIAAEVYRRDRRLTPSLLVIAGCVIAVSCVGFWQVVTGAGPPTFSIEGVTRAFGTFGEPNPFAGYLEMTVLLLIAVTASRIAASGGVDRVEAPDHLVTAILAVASILGTATLVATQSRGGYLGFAAGLVLAVWMTGGRVRRLGLLCGSLCIALALASPIAGRFAERVRLDSLLASGGQVTSENFAAQERAAHWRAAVNMAKASPLLGVGAGNYNDRFRELTSVWRFRIPRGHAHNAYLQALAQAGLMGLVSYLGLLVVVVARIRRALRFAETSAGRAVAIGAAAVTTAVVVHNMVEYLHVLSLGLQLSIVWAFLEATHATESANSRRTRQSPASAA
jgi:putative inorganic carbon (HCO3(-)) transporter